MSNTVDTTELVHVRGLSATLTDGTRIVHDVDLRAAAGRIIAVVGESGSGKTTAALALLGYSAPGVRLTGSVSIAGHEMLGRSEDEVRRLRGRLVAYVAQDPTTALNPAMKVRDVIGTMLRHVTNDRPQAIRSALQAVDLPVDETFLRRYPHQLSGGQQQRLLIAAAMACGPKVLVLDEPSTGLDVVSKAVVLDEIRRLRDNTGVTIVLISHDLGVVQAVSERVSVMYAGQIVEVGDTRDLTSDAQHPYTRGLIAAIPSHTQPTHLVAMPGIAASPHERPSGCSFAPRCPQRTNGCAVAPELDETGPDHSVRCIHADQQPPIASRPATSARRATPTLLAVSGLVVQRRRQHHQHLVLDGIDLDVGEGERLAVVGPSGCGKTTLARSVAGLLPWSAGTITVNCTELGRTTHHRSPAQLRDIQIVFQNPYESLNPRRRIGPAVARPAQRLRGLSKNEATRMVPQLLESVRLPAATAGRYPHELSGGERQRVAIAQALASQPRLLICDEITSALDVSVQAAVIELLRDLSDRTGLALLFVSHDLGVVASIADRIVLLDAGRVTDAGTVDQILAHPSTPSTRRLLDAAARLELTVTPAIPLSTQ